MNADFLCPDCGKVHKNAVIEGFNVFMALVDPNKEWGEAETRCMFKSYCAGQHDALFSILQFSVNFDEGTGARLTNAYAVQLRSAMIEACPGLTEQQHAHMHYSLTEKFFIRDGQNCHGN